MKTAIITGASAGLGMEFARQLPDAFPHIECVWLIARRQDKLDETAAALGGLRCKTIALDLCDSASFDALSVILENEKPDIQLLVNNAGCGYLCNIGEGSLSEQNRMVDLNIRALTAVTHLSIPYMSRGAKIINMSSIASFCPNARMTVYSSSKSYVSAFSRGLGEELRSRGISVTAVCSGPLKTEFLDIGRIAGNSKMFETLPYCVPEKVVSGAYTAAKAGRPVHTPRGFFKLYRVLAKLLPQRLLVKLAKT